MRTTLAILAAVSLTTALAAQRSTVHRPSQTGPIKTLGTPLLVMGGLRLEY